MLLDRVTALEAKLKCLTSTVPATQSNCAVSMHEAANYKKIVDEVNAARDAAVHAMTAASVAAASAENSAASADEAVRQAATVPRISAGAGLSMLPTTTGYMLELRLESTRRSQSNGNAVRLNSFGYLVS